MGDRPANEKWLICEDGFGFPPIAGEPKFAAKRNEVGDPVVNINRKLIEIIYGYKPLPENFSSLKVDGVNQCCAFVATIGVPEFHGLIRFFRSGDHQRE